MNIWQQVWQYLHYPYVWDLKRDSSIPNLLYNHLYLTGVSMLIALLIAIPISLLIVRFSRLYLPAITLAGVAYTIPSLVVLAFLVSYTGLTDTTVIIPLVIYAQIVLIRNIVAAIRSVDPALLDVGRGMGMSELQLQIRVIFPLALPVSIAGIRVAAVTTIGIATIAPLVGVQDLGYLIFQGLNPIYPAQILTGVLLISLLAIVVDLLLQGLQRLLGGNRTINAVL